MTFNTSFDYDQSDGWIKHPNTVLDYQVDIGHLPFEGRDYISPGSGTVYNIAGYYYHPYIKITG